jgi:hypothetical protein
VRRFKRLKPSHKGRTAAQVVRIVEPLSDRFGTVAVRGVHHYPSLPLLRWGSLNVVFVGQQQPARPARSSQRSPWAVAVVL